MQAVIGWITDNYVEILGFIFGISYLFLSIKQKASMWPLGIIMSLFYIWIFYTGKFYADSALQVYYVIISIYGWLLWSKGIEDTRFIYVTHITKKKLAILVFTTLIIWLAISFILVQTDSTVPYWDAFTSAVAITATWMLSRKIIEHWIAWLIVNPISVGLYIYKEYYITAFLYIILTVLAVEGYRKWKNTIPIKAEK